MTDDTISTDPKRVEEARRAAAEATQPKPPFDPKAIAREEYERVVLKSIEAKSFEDTWKDFGEISEGYKNTQGEVMGAMTESEYRQTVSSLFHRLNYFHLMRLAGEQEERSQVLAKASLFAITDRIRLKEATNAVLDPTFAVYRRAAQTSCAIHPNGCPQPGDNATTPNTSPGLELLRAVLNKIKGGSTG